MSGGVSRANRKRARCAGPRPASASAPVFEAALILAAAFARPALAQSDQPTATPPAPPAVSAPKPEQTKAARRRSVPAKAVEPPGPAATVKSVTVHPKPPPEYGAVVGDIKPELQLSPEDIQSYGVSTVIDLLNEIAPQTRSDHGRTAGTATSPVILINGRRISSINEVQNIPTEAILRIDILPEEVSLKYGYTADQRVVNIVLKPLFRSISGEGVGGTTTGGGDATSQEEIDHFRVEGDKRLNLDLKYQYASGLTDAQRGLAEPDDETGAAADHSLLPATNTLTANAVMARPFLWGINATVNATLTGTTSSSLQGLPGLGVPTPEGDPFSPFSVPALVDRSVAGQGPLTQDIDGWTGHLGLTLNRDVGHWRLSLTTAYNHAYTLTETGTGSLSTAVGTTDGGNIQVLANGPLVRLPAGDLYVSAKIGDVEAVASSSSVVAGVTSAQTLARNDAQGQLNLDFPIASRSDGVLAPLGELSVFVNTAIDEYSDFGPLPTLGYGVNWTPIPGYNVIVSEIHDHLAPTLQQLDGPVVATPGVRLFDYSTGETVAVTQLTGGNPDLEADDRHILKVGLTLKPLPTRELTVTANYIASHIANTIQTFPAATAAIEAAYPDRFIRDADGDLVEEDDRAVNFASQDRQELRWGVNFSMPVGKQPPPSPYRRGYARRRGPPAGGYGGAFGGEGAGGGEGAQTDESASGQAGGSAQSGAGPTLLPEPGARGGGGFGGRGYGGGGFGGRGGRGGFGGGQTPGGRFQVALYHTVYFKDQFQVTPGGPVLNLLDGAPVGSAGGQYRHEIEGQLGYTDNGYGIRFSADWRSSTAVFGGGAASTGVLEFSDVATINMRLWDDFTPQRALISRYPSLQGVRLTLNVTNLLNQSISVRDSVAATPFIYQSALLDPTGRVISINLRKLFY